MIGLDTDVLVRYIVLDDSSQSALATDLIENEFRCDFPGYISHVVLCEFECVLSGIYGYPRAKIAKVLERILKAEQLCVEDPETVRRALRDYRKKGMGFSDHLIAHANQRQGCEYTVTLDFAASESTGMVLLR